MDKHKCNITLGAVSHNASDVVLLPSPAKNSSDSPLSTDIWNIALNDPVFYATNVIGYPLNWKTSIVKRSLQLERKPDYFWIAIMIPMILLCVVTFCAVILPRDSSDKISLLITCFLAQVVFLDVVLKMLPITSNYVSLLVSFVVMVLVATVAQILLVCITLYIDAEAACESGSLTRARRLWKAGKNLFSRRRQANPTVSPSTAGNNEQHDDGNEISGYEARRHEFKAREHDIEVSKHGLEVSSLDVASKDRTGGEMPEGLTDEEQMQFKRNCLFVCRFLETLSFVAAILVLFVSPVFLDLMFYKIIPSFCS